MTSKSCGGNEEQSSLIKAATFTDFELIDLRGQNSLQSRSTPVHFVAELEDNSLSKCHLNWLSSQGVKGQGEDFGPAELQRADFLS